MGCVALAVAATPAAAVTPSKDALAIANAIADHPSFVVGAEFETAPPNGNTAALSSDVLAGFPTSLETAEFAILSTGDLNQLATNTDPMPLDPASADLGGGAVRGGSERDVTTLRLDVQVPTGASCLQLDYRFLSEEWPEYAAAGEAGNSFNDAFIVELDGSDWVAQNDEIVTVRTFARTPVTVLSSGPTMTGYSALGTPFDGAEPIRQAWAPATPGPHSVFFSIFDLLDGEQDSAVFLDQLVFGTDMGDFCAPGPTLVTRTFADAPQSFTGSRNGYSILVEGVGELPNPDATLSAPIDTALVEAISNFLAPGFTYIPGSTTGATAADPTSDDDGLLTWQPPLAQGAGDAVKLHFDVSVPEEPGVYRNRASAKVAGYFLLPSPPSAPIDVVAAAADVVLSHTQMPLPAVVGQKLTLSFTATNRGPQPATRLLLQGSLPRALGGPTVTTTHGTCLLSLTLVCELGTLAANSTATVTVIGVLERTDGLALSAGARAAEVDVDLANNKLSARSAVIAALVTGDAAEPVFGATVATTTKRGKIKVRPPGAKEFVEIEEKTAIPVGSVVDARKGEVKITSAVDAGGAAQAASFEGAKFVVKQRGSGLTTVKLVGGNFSKCKPTGARSTQRFIKDGARRRRVIRRMWGRGKGKFRTRGRYASATVRGTVWRTIDRCDGTLIRVKRGVVVVRDVNRKRSVAVKAGERYLVKRPTSS